MGGSVFSSGPDSLRTPRMPKDVYFDRKERIISILQDHFQTVDTPIEGPEKEDFGDIDIVLYGFKYRNPSRENIVELLESELSAVRSKIVNHEEISLSVAIPWDIDSDSESSSDGSVRTAIRDGPDTPPPPVDYIQVDLRVCDTFHRLEWVLFKHAHGDAWNMIGTIIRPYGLTVDEQALWLRIPEYEHINRKRARIELTTHPFEILDFLNLDSDEFFSGPFGSFHELCEFIALCRMFYVPPLEDSSDEAGGPSAEGQDRRELKANDRKRMKVRPGFRRWIEEYIPECRREGKYVRRRTNREEIMYECFDRFAVEREYNARKKEFMQEQEADYIWTTLIKGSIPAPPADSTDTKAQQYRGTLVKALKKILLEDNKSYGVVAPKMRNSEGSWDLDRVKAWIEEVKDTVGRIAYDQQYAAYQEKKAAQAANNAN
ncbi:uncharacterized protein J7T54_000425 [Emericellopsis cladophorae]|uniref:Uncharacterized protein n=1 Tax=Emericellopsis cladophorae TaxID=2686198 RepID=A0A9Q0BB04_9HYPO|nr:uncharacterized protein J7T54_000425 [Emericellopsis cladophorae]KAI6779327.1 hypothetical protein J7T54_000425 [Emericellopsis cladophorae]